MWFILLREFFQDLRKQKLRTSLTLVAITWGTIAVVTLLAFGEGLTNRMMQGMMGGGNQVIIFFGGQTSRSYEGLDVGRRIRFSEEDVDLIRQTVPYIELISPQYHRGVSLRSEHTSTNTHMEAVNPSFEEMRTMYPVAGGRFLNERDLAEHRRVVFLGNQIAEQLFPDGDAVGSQIEIDRTPYTVVGVMHEKLQMAMSYGPDSRRAVIPYTTFRQVYSHRYLNSILIRPSDPAHQEAVIEGVREVMARKYRFDRTDHQAIGVWDFVEAMKIQERVFLGIKIFLFAIGFFTLLIAGVGVANIMYVVVKERTREIGVKKAIGARNRQIVSQFIFEALFICLMGGAAGLLISIGIVQGVLSLGLEGGAADFLGSPELSVDAMIMTTGVLTMIGLLAGIFPARRAALVDPVESLRYE